MNFRSITIITLLFSLCIGAAPKKDATRSFNILIALPSDVSVQKGKNNWATAFFDTYIRFRLEPLKEINFLSDEKTYQYIPSIYTYTQVQENQYYAAAQKSGCTHILFPHFELTKNKTAMMEFSLLAVSSKENIVSFDKEFPVDQIASQIDSMLIKFFPQINVNLTAQSSRFFQIVIAGPNFKSIKQLGEILYDERTLNNPSYSKLANEYERCIQKDPTLLIAHSACSEAMMKTGQYEKASKYLKQLLDLVPVHTDLFISLAKSYRLSNKINDAFLIVSKFDQMGLMTIPYLFEKAKVFEEMKQQTNAYKVYYKILQTEPTHKDALLFCARYHNNDNKFNNSLPFSDALLKIDNSNGYGYFERGRSMLGSGRIDQACTSLRKANELQPSDPLLSEYLGDALAKLDKFDDAALWYKKALQLSAKNTTLLLKTSKAIENSGKPADALELLRKNAAAYSGEPVISKNIGLLEFVNKNYSAVIAPLNEYLKKDPNDYEVLYTLGESYEKTGNTDAALETYQKALPRTNDKVKCNISIARIYLLKKDTKSSQQILREIISQRKVKGVYSMLGDAALLNNNNKEALTSYLKERELHGNDKLVQEKIARLLFVTESFGQSSIEYKRLLQINPDHQEARYYIAIVMLKDGNLSGAESVLREAPAYGSGSLEIHYLLGSEFFDKKSYKRAIEYFDNALVIKADHEDALRKCALSEIKSGNETDGAERYMKLFDINNSKYSNLLAEAGHLFFKNESNAKAAAAYMLFLNKGFTDPEVNRRYAEIEYTNKNYQNVCSLLKNISGNSAEEANIMLFLADSRCQTGDYKGAIPLLNRILPNDQSNKLAIKLAAVSYEKTGDTKKAIGFYEAYCRLPKDKDFVSVSYHLGELYESVQMVDNAINQYELTRKLFPEDLRFHERLSLIYINKSMWKQAQDVLENAIESPEAKPDFLKKLAQTYRSRDAVEKSISTWKKYLEKSSDDADGWKDLGKIYYSQQKYSDAIVVLNKAYQLKPADFGINAILGKTYVEANEYKKAIVSLGHARKAKADDLEMIELTAKCYRNIKETSSLAALLKEWITLDPKRYDIKMELGSIYLNERESDKALEYLKDAVTFLPTEYRPNLLLAQVFEIMGNDSLRLQHLKKAAKLSPDNWEVSYEYARYYLSKNKLQDAQKELVKVISIKPEHAQSHYELALLFIEDDKNSDALSEVTAALKYEPENVIYNAVTAYVYSLNNMPNEAIASIKTALKGSSQNPLIYYYASQVYRLCNNQAYAFDNVNKALQIDANFAKGYDALGDLYFEAFKFKDASTNYFLAWEKGGYTAHRALNLGNALSSNLQFNEAKGFYESILNHDSPSSEAVYRTIYAYCKLGDIKNARRFQKYFQKDAAPWMQLAQGILYETENNPEAALTAYSIAQKIAPDNLLVYGGFGRIYAQHGKIDLSIDNFRLAMKDSLNVQNYIDIATVFQEKGLVDSALAYYEKVNSRFPEHPWVQIYIATLQSQQNDHKAAIATLHRGIEYHSSDPMLHFLLGQELEQSGNFEDAISEYQISLKTGNGQPIEALRNIGTIYLQKLINDKKAKEYYKKYVKAGGNKEEVADAMK